MVPRRWGGHSEGQADGREVGWEDGQRALSQQPLPAREEGPLRWRPPHSAALKDPGALQEFFGVQP